MTQPALAPSAGGSECQRRRLRRRRITRARHGAADRCGSVAGNDMLALMRNRQWQAIFEGYWGTGRQPHRLSKAPWPVVYGHPALRSPRFDDEPEARKRTPSRVRSGSRSRCLPAAVAALAACVACSVIRSADRAPQSKEPSEQVVFRVGSHGQDCWQGGVAEPLPRSHCQNWALPCPVRGPTHRSRKPSDL